MRIGGWQTLALVTALVLFSSAALADVPEHPTETPIEAKAAGQPAEDHGTGEHGDAHGGHGPGEINWFHGFLGEREGAEPSLLWRPKGMPPPFGAMLLNTAILFYVLGRFGAPKVANALARRKATIMHGMDEAAKMKEDAASRLADYEAKLARIDEDIERVKKDMREAGEAERVRMLAEAKERRARMERDARLLIELELKAAREELVRETVDSAVRSAEERLTKQVTVADQQRIAEHYLKSVGTAFGGKA
jgi:F-type H+-transporting ATPase subunit b